MPQIRRQVGKEEQLHIIVQNDELDDLRLLLQELEAPDKTTRAKLSRWTTVFNLGATLKSGGYKKIDIHET
jgi:hypothetical protein